MDKRSLPLSQTSGDPRLDRRFDYALAALEDCDAAGAADILEQCLAEAPHWAVAWQRLGEAREMLGHRDAAARAFEAAHRHDADGVLGADLDLARLGAAAPERAGTLAYVAALFDEYAARFDRHLRRNLAYRGPEILFEAVMRAATLHARPLRFGATLDLGCGTGLAAEVFTEHAGPIDGVDLSAKMIAKAKAKGLYRHLAVADLAAALAAEPPGGRDLVLAADVFVYIGDLAPVFAATRGALARDGLFAFTVQRGDDADIAVGADKRFAHSEGYLHRTLGEAGLRPILIEPAVTRQDAGEDVPGLVAVAVRA